MTVRVLEAVYDKGAGSNEIYNYILGEIKPTMEELGLSTPEELGLAKWCQLQGILDGFILLVLFVFAVSSTVLGSSLPPAIFNMHGAIKAFTVFCFSKAKGSEDGSSSRF